MNIDKCRLKTRNLSPLICVPLRPFPDSSLPIPRIGTVPILGGFEFAWFGREARIKLRGELVAQQPVAVAPGVYLGLPLGFGAEESGLMLFAAWL